MSDFASQVRVNALAISPNAVAAAIAFYEEKGLVRPGAVADCIQLAGEFHRFGTSKTGKVVRVGKPKPALSLTSGDLTAHIRPAVEQVRLELFGKPRPPFRTRPKAAGWIRRTAGDTKARWVPDQEAGKRLLDANLAVLGRRSEPDFLRYYGKAGGETTTEVRPETPLQLIARASNDLGERTGFAPADVVEFILIGRSPTLPPATVQFETQDELGRGGEVTFSRSWAVVTVNATDMSITEMRRVLQKIRRRFGTVRLKPLTQQHLKLQRLVDELGGEPSAGMRGGKTAFWKRLQKEWNGRRLGPRYDDWTGPRMAYYRLKKRLARARSLSAKKADTGVFSSMVGGGGVEPFPVGSCRP